MAKLPAYSGEEFWKVWNPDLIPDENERTPSSIKLPDDNYNKISASFDETAWAIDSNSTVSEGSVGNIIDGKTDTKQLTIAGGGSYVVFAESGQSRPVYKPSLWVCFDMRKVYTVDHIYIKPRYFTSSAHVNFYEFQVEVKLNPDDEWFDLGNYHIADWGGKTPTAAQLAWYDFDVPEDKIVSARYVRLTFIKGQKTSGKTNWDYTQSGGVSVDEFKLGGTIFLGGEDSGEESGEDTDFPEWN